MLPLAAQPVMLKVVHTTSQMGHTVKLDIRGISLISMHNPRYYAAARSDLWGIIERRGSLQVDI